MCFKEGTPGNYHIPESDALHVIPRSSNPQHVPGYLGNLLRHTAERNQQHVLILITPNLF